MGEGKVAPSGRERSFSTDELIVSKTDPKGRLTYVNDVFLKVSGFTEPELTGQAHSIIRHPEMPRCIFKLLWDTISSGKELFAYVNNMAKNGDNYWVFAHVTPNFDANHQIIGYHSNRRVPEPDALGVVKPLYAKLLAEESRHQDRKAGLDASWAMLQKAVADAGFDSYDRMVFAITPER
ncbi:chemotaxis protein [Paramagnetospirillum kuznetsovii]|uniref:Chemotaxis protein n=1 Tax=Paramagnetospirillum kuznetsovii TaxID=2053833 RepID=A0A364P1Q3_9PROT|nr:PAS domain-containing protein [Paramagnetospirillum kuznetsovii]RAU23045.1 chemotaxis protein [Paramagnetospirillum kuznetsovii]